MNNDTSNNTDIPQINPPSSMEILNLLTNLINSELNALGAAPFENTTYTQTNNNTTNNSNNDSNNYISNSTDNSANTINLGWTPFQVGRRIYERGSYSRRQRRNPFHISYEEYPNLQNLNNTTDNSHNTIYTQIISDLMNLPPIPEHPSNNLEEIINNTLNVKNTYKQVLSEEGEKKIKKIKFNPEIHKETICCPITQIEFKENDEISELPCGHIFDTTAILTWLKNEKAACPCCRYKLPSIEKKEEPEVQEVQETRQLFTPSSRPSRWFNLSENIPVHPFGPRRGISNLSRLFRSREERLEEEEIQRALLASLEDQYMPSNDVNNENTNKEKNSPSPPTSDDEIDIDLYNSDSNDEMNLVD